MVSARTIVGSAGTLQVRIKALAKEHRARCLVIEPVSALSKAGNELTARATFAGVTLALTTVALADTYIPALCAMRIDPITTLRSE